MKIIVADAFASVNAIHLLEIPPPAEYPSGAGAWVFKEGENMELYFYPEKTEEVPKLRGITEEGRIYKLTEIVSYSKSSNAAINLPGYAEYYEKNPISL